MGQLSKDFEAIKKTPRKPWPTGGSYHVCGAGALLLHMVHAAITSGRAQHKIFGWVLLATED